jgi:hypothetical protein
MTAKINTIIHNGTTYTPDQPTLINDNVIGLGTYIDESPKLTFAHYVGYGQTINIGGNREELDILDPGDFHGHVIMSVGFVAKAPIGYEQKEVGMQLVGRAVDSYSYHNDMLKLWNHDRVVDALSLTTGPNGITVQRAPSGWIYASANVPHVPGDSTPAQIAASLTRGVDFLGYLSTPAMPVHV